MNKKNSHNKKTDKHDKIKHTESMQDKNNMHDKKLHDSDKKLEHNLNKHEKIKHENVQDKKLDKYAAFDRKLFIFIFLSLILLGAIIYFSFKVYSALYVLNIQNVNYTLNVTDHVGFILDSDKLHFGGVIPGGHSSRSLAIRSDIEGFVFVKSDDANFIHVNNQGIKVGPDMNAQFDFKAIVPKDVEAQNIEGTLYFLITKSDKLWPLKIYQGDLIPVFIEELKPPSITINISNDD